MGRDGLRRVPPLTNDPDVPFRDTGIPRQPTMQQNSIQTDRPAHPDETASELPTDDASPEEVTTEEPTTSATELPLDVVFDLLSNERRRQVLRYLETTSETTLGDLAEHIAAIENDKPEGDLTSTERKRVYICLYQCHLPKLNDAGVIDFDEHRKTVTRGGSIEHIRPYLPADEPASVADPWPRYYLGLSLLGVGAFAAASLLSASALLSGVTLGLFLVAVSVVALGQFRGRERETSVGALSDPAGA